MRRNTIPRSGGHNSKTSSKITILIQSSMSTRQFNSEYPEKKGNLRLLATAKVGPNQSNSIVASRAKGFWVVLCLGYTLVEVMMNKLHRM